jgi:signal peptidase II
LAGTEPVAQSEGPQRHRINLRAIVSLAVVAAVVLGADQFTKFLIVSNLDAGERLSVLGELIQFVFVKNSGAAFSLASGYTWIFSIAASAVTVFIVLFAHRIKSLAWAMLFGMLLGGTLGNLLDRLFREPSFGLGHVVDFIQVWGFPAIFNVADIFIVSSMGLFIILSIRGVRLDGTREAAIDPDTVPEAK